MDDPLMKHRGKKHSIIALLSAISLFACTADNPQFVDPSYNSPCEDGQLVIDPFNLAAPFKVDILFVVDNSDGMGAVQGALSAAMPRFVQQLNSVASLDYQLAVTSTDIFHADQKGQLQTGVAGQQGCPGDRAPIITRNTQAGPTVAACNVVLGEQGDSFESGLEAVRFATHGPHAEPGGTNEGFLRADSRFVVIVVTNENDCSHGSDLDRSDSNNCEWERGDLIDMSVYVGDGNSYFEAVKAQYSGAPVDFVAIVGPDDGIVYEQPQAPSPVCAANGNAFNGRRYLEVVNGMGDRGGFYSICTQRYESLLTSVLEDHILPRHEVVCPFLNLTQEPVSVRLVDLNNQNTIVPLPEDHTGYIYLGETEDCSNGALLLSPDRHGVLGESERIEVHYCTDEPPE